MTYRPVSPDFDSARSHLPVNDKLFFTSGPRTPFVPGDKVSVKSVKTLNSRSRRHFLVKRVMSSSDKQRYQFAASSTGWTPKSHVGPLPCVLHTDPPLKGPPREYRHLGAVDGEDATRYSADVAVMTFEGPRRSNIAILVRASDAFRYLNVKLIAAITPYPVSKDRLAQRMTFRGRRIADLRRIIAKSRPAEHALRCVHAGFQVTLILKGLMRARIGRSIAEEVKRLIKRPISEPDGQTEPLGSA